MSCEDYRAQWRGEWEAEATSELRDHIARCPACAAAYRDFRLVRAGLDLWKQEAPPQPSVGFAERLVRQLSEISKAPSVAEFFERVGRRFVYVALVLTSLALLALSLPATGPVRGLSISDIQISSQEASLAYSDPIGETGAQELPDLAPTEVPTPPSSHEVK
jgi:anti-sigma factor RsiW